MESLTPEEQNIVLQLGLTMYRHGKEYLSGAETKAHQEELRSLREMYRREAEESQRDYDTRLFEQTEKYKLELKELREQFQATVKERAMELSKEREEIYRRQLADVIERERNDREKLEREHAERMRNLQDLLDRLMGTYANSQKRGQVGENIAADELARVFPDADDVIFKGKEGHSGDYHVLLPELGRVIMDIKHHDKSSGGVRKKDREKLLRDLDENTDGAVGGILVVTQATIQGMESGSVVYSPEKKLPMVACCLRGDWDRLKDARAILGAILQMKRQYQHQHQQHQDSSMGMGNEGADDDASPSPPMTSSGDILERVREDAMKSLRETLNRLREQRDVIRGMMIQNTRMMGEMCSAMMRIDPGLFHGDDDVDSWLYANVEIMEKPIPDEERASVGALAELPGAPEILKKTRHRANVRELLVSAGATFLKGADKITNARIKN
jgi:hypothetical protein